MEYHPIKPDNTSSKMLYSTAIKFSGIPASRVEDSAFWLALHVDLWVVQFSHAYILIVTVEHRSA